MFTGIILHSGTIESFERQANGARLRLRVPDEFDLQRGEIRKEGGKIELTPKEFELAVTLFRNMGRLLSRGHLQETVWGRSGDLATRTVDTHVSQVRKKLDLRPESGYRVVPVYNYGYRLERIGGEAPRQ